MRIKNWMILASLLGIVTIGGCVSSSEFRKSSCPDCTDEQWERINNPTPQDRAKFDRLNQEREKAKSSSDARTRKSQIDQRNFIEGRLKQCIQNKNLTNEPDLEFIKVACSSEYQAARNIRLTQCKRERNLENASNEFALRSTCKKYVETGSY